MKKNKKTYSTPEVEILVVRFEGNLLNGSPYGQTGKAGAAFTLSNTEDDEDYIM